MSRIFSGEPLSLYQVTYNKIHYFVVDISCDDAKYTLEEYLTRQGIEPILGKMSVVPALEVNARTTPTFLSPTVNAWNQYLISHRPSVLAKY